VDFAAMERDQMDKCTPDQIEMYDQEMRSKNLPTLDELDKMCFLVREMLSVTLEDKDLFIRDEKKGNFQRLIFGSPIDLELDEEKHAEKFMQFVTKFGHNIPEEYWTNDRLMLRFLAAEKNNYAKTLISMVEHSQWLRMTFPANLSMISSLLNSGFLYVCKRDIQYRPVMVLNVNKMNQDGSDISVISEATAFFCDFVVKKLLVPGKVENWIMIIDLNGVNITTLPIKKVQAIVGAT
jgi:hypothetical protein